MMKFGITPSAIKKMASTTKNKEKCLSNLKENTVIFSLSSFVTEGNIRAIYHTVKIDVSPDIKKKILYDFSPGNKYPRM